MKNFKDFDNDNPHIYQLFKMLTLDYIKSGRTKISAKLIVEEIRWHYWVKSKAAIKVNNSFTCWYARKFAMDYPQHAGLFNFKHLKNLDIFGN